MIGGDGAVELVDEDAIMVDILDIAWLSVGRLALIEVVVVGFCAIIDEVLDVDRLEVDWRPPIDELDETAGVEVRVVDVVLESDTIMAATNPLLMTRFPEADL